MDFTKRLRERVRRGEITCSVRIWMGPRVKPGNRYAISEGGEIEIDSIDEIELADITPALARESGFASVVDLLKVAQHGRGRNVYLVRFHYLGPKARARAGAAAAAARSPAREKRRAPVSGERQRKRVLRILARLPEAVAVAQGTHLSLEVRKKRFGYFLADHHGDGRIALVCKASGELRDALQENVPLQFHIPKYVGNKGWIGLWLDTDPVDWSAVELALGEGYALVAPKTLPKAKSRSVKEV